MHRALAAAFAAAVLALVACGGEEREAELWPGPPQAREGGAVPVEGFNDLIEARDPDWARSPLLAAAAFYGETARPGSEAGSLSVVEGRPAQEDVRSVVLTEDGLPDDSVRAVRWELRFERADDGRWRLAEARWSQRCREGRGHQDFRPELCV